MKKLFIIFSILIFSAESLLAQSASDAKNFLVENWKSSEPGYHISLTIATCDRFEFRLNKNGDDHKVHTSFDPRDGFLSADDNGLRAGLWCTSGECAVRKEGGKSHVSEFIPSLVSFQRLKSAFEAFQKSCGGPKKSAF